MLKKFFDNSMIIKLVFLGVIFFDIGLLCLVVLMPQHVEHSIKNSLNNTVCDLLQQVVSSEETFLLQVKVSVYEVAKALSREKNLSSSFKSDSIIVPELYLSFALLRFVSHVSYLGSDGLLFSYYHDGSKSYTLKANLSHSVSEKTNLYSSVVTEFDQETGQPIGIPFNHPIRHFNKTWLRNVWINGALATDYDIASWGVGWETNSTDMIFFTAPVSDIGVVSLGISTGAFMDHIAGINLESGYLSLVIKGKEVLKNAVPHTHYVVDEKIVSVLAGDQKNLTSGNQYGKFSCHVNNVVAWHPTSFLKILGDKYEYGCSNFNASGVQLVAILAFPCKSVLPYIQKMKIALIVLHAFFIVCATIGCVYVLCLLRRSQFKESHLMAKLIKQKHINEQVERKSKHRSLAFASASHDVRNSLAAMMGLIELSRCEAADNYQLNMNLNQMVHCAEKLLRLINTVLDVSKVEAGKMQLDEYEFDMAQVLEESTEMFNITAVCKGIEIIWDPCDGSVLKCSKVKGDCNRFIQILDNLLSNAVKFTSEGHIVLRAWAKKPIVEETVTVPPVETCKFPSILRPLLKWLRKREGSINRPVENNAVQYDPIILEFVFEIDDTGKGIPKDKHALVFENYVQIKEQSSDGHHGTGLGLGIVQSYVRLMGGDISIKDKERGQRGTCFRFNIFLKSNEMMLFEKDDEVEEDKEIEPDSNFSPTQTLQRWKKFYVEPHVRAKVFTTGLSLQGIHSVLFIRSDATREILEKWMNSLGITVWAVQQRQYINPTLDNLEQILRDREAPLKSSKEEKKTSPEIEIDETLSLCIEDLKRIGSKVSSTNLVVVIDSSEDYISDILGALYKFMNTVQHDIKYKMVWLAKVGEYGGWKHDNIQCDLFLPKPIHGLRLYALLKLLEELKPLNEVHLPHAHVNEVVLQTGTMSQKASNFDTNMKTSVSSHHVRSSYERGESSKSKGIIQDDKPLSGMNILIVEDSQALRYVAVAIVSHLGANTQTCENGLEALDVVQKTLNDINDFEGLDEIVEVSELVPFHVILMDCEMPIMNGYEATEHIRKVESSYGFRIPIIAVSGHEGYEEEQRTLNCGMDYHLTKPLTGEKLLNAITIVRLLIY